MGVATHLARSLRLVEVQPDQMAVEDANVRRRGISGQLNAIEAQRWVRIVIHMSDRLGAPVDVHNASE